MNIRREYYTIPKRIGFIISDEEREKINELLREKNRLQRKGREILDQYDLETEESVKAYSEAFNKYRNSEDFRREVEINNELAEIAEQADRRHADSFKSPTALYRKALKTAKSLSLTLTPEQQASYLTGTSLPTRNPVDAFPFVDVNFDNVPEEDRFRVCNDFFLDNLDIQNYLAVCELKGWGQEPILQAVEKQTAKYYNRPATGLEPAKIDEYAGKPYKAELSEDLNKLELYSLPSGQIPNLIQEALGAGSAIANLPARKEEINHNTAYSVYENDKGRQLVMENSKAKITLEIRDIDKLTGSNKPAKKLFVLALIKAGTQAHGGTLARDGITFPLQELVDIGFYSSTRSARQGFNDGADVLTSLKVKGQVKKTSKKESTVDALEVLFTGARIEHGQCTLFFNPRIDWGFIAPYYTILPSYYFKLPNKASDLLLYIFYLARQNTQHIEERGYFTISFKAIQQRLQLPNEKQTKNPQRDIKEVIEEAITQIEDEHKLKYDNMEMSLLPVYNEEGTIAEYLTNGYLKVSLSGGFSETFIKISKDTKARIEQSNKRRERIIEKAQIANTAKALEDRKE